MMRIISACGSVNDVGEERRFRNASTELHASFVVERGDREDVHRPQADDRWCYGIIQVDCDRPCRSCVRILHPANVARHLQHRATNKGSSTDVAVRRSQ